MNTKNNNTHFIRNSDSFVIRRGEEQSRTINPFVPKGVLGSTKINPFSSILT